MALAILSGTFMVTPAVLVALSVRPSSPVMVSRPFVVDQVEALLPVRVRAWAVPAVKVKAPPAGPVKPELASALLKVILPVAENCTLSVPLPISRGAEGVGSPIPMLPEGVTVKSSVVPDVMRRLPSLAPSVSLMVIVQSLAVVVSEAVEEMWSEEGPKEKSLYSN